MSISTRLNGIKGMSVAEKVIFASVFVILVTIVGFGALELIGGAS